MSLSHSEFACGLRTGVLTIASPRHATAASNPLEKVTSLLWMIKRYRWSGGWLTQLLEGPGRGRMGSHVESAEAQPG